MKCSIIILAVFVCGCVSSQSEKAEQPVIPGQFGEASIPAGSLGYPLGTYLTIEGIRVETGKVGTRTLRIDTINSRKLPEPIDIWVDNVKHPGLPAGTRCVIRGYESGKMIGVPFEVAKAENSSLPQAGWQFKRYFIITSVVEPASLEKE